MAVLITISIIITVTVGCVILCKHKRKRKAQTTEVAHYQSVGRRSILGWRERARRCAHAKSFHALRMCEYEPS